MKEIVSDTSNLNALKRYGYFVAPLLSRDQADHLADMYREQGSDTGRPGFSSTMFVEDSDFRKEVDLLIKHQLSEPLSKELSDFKILFANFIVKRSGSDSAVQVHQDWAFVDERQHASLNVWIALTDCNERNGCLHVVPGSHKLCNYPRASPSNLTLDVTAVRERSIALPVKKGMAVFYYGSLLHFSDTIADSTPMRLAIGLTCIADDAVPFHFHRNEETQRVDVYEVSTDFFYSHRVDGPVVNQLPVQQIDAVNHRHFSAHELDESLFELRTSVGHYYDEWHERYLSVYGNVIQALRPASEYELLEYLTASIGLKTGMRVLDAGCGTGGPAIHFAQRFDLRVDALTVSPKQVVAARERARLERLTGRVSVSCIDYHEMDRVYPIGTYDAVLFLESLGHAEHPEKVLSAAVNLLKPGGFIFIKDFFPRLTKDSELAGRIARTVQNINRHYEYNVLDLNHTVTFLRESGCSIECIRKSLFQDDITVRSDFETRFGIEVFDGGEFPAAEWLELKFIKNDF